jgi:prepilin-type N-terminal cleavage/methylation domain-containing protein
MSDARGFSLSELLVAVVLLAFGLLSVVPLFVLATRENSVGEDLGFVGAAAVGRLERLREQSYVSPSLAAGGSLDSDAAGYFDDSDPEVLVRWLITDNASPDGSKTLVVRAVARESALGQGKRVTLTTVRADEP